MGVEKPMIVTESLRIVIVQLLCDLQEGSVYGSTHKTLMRLRKLVETEAT